MRDCPLPIVFSRSFPCHTPFQVWGAGPCEQWTTMKKRTATILAKIHCHSPGKPVSFWNLYFPCCRPVAVAVAQSTKPEQPLMVRGLENGQDIPPHPQNSSVATFQQNLHLPQLEGHSTAFSHLMPQKAQTAFQNGNFLHMMQGSYAVI